MGAKEKEAYKAWREKNGYQEGELERVFAQNSRRSVEKSWEGFLSTAEVLHSDWVLGGKEIGELDHEHTEGRKVLIVASDGDTGTPHQWGEYLAAKYSNARLKRVDGGHIASLFHMDEIWIDFLET